MDGHIVKLVKLWLAKAKHEKDIFSRFVFYYFCFNAIAANLSAKESDAQMITWLCENDNPIKNRFFKLFNLDGTPYFPQRIETLKNLGPIHSNLQGKTPRSITDIRNFEEVIRAIYCVRCNLFHGAKSPNSIRDYKLVKVSGDILQKLVAGI